MNRTDVAIPLAALACLIALSACSSVSRKPESVSAPHSPSRATEDLPRISAPRFATGKASWYGGRFHGRRTASGERFDMHAFTAAHRTLPFGTRVEVRNPKNGKSVVVRVNDRGPGDRKRVIDLSRAAAKELGMLGHGIVPVEIAELPNVD